MTEPLARAIKRIEDAQAADMEFKYDRPAEALARAAIAAIREPSNAMIGAGKEAIKATYGRSTAREVALIVWKVMHAAMIEE